MSQFLNILLTFTQRRTARSESHSVDGKGLHGNLHASLSKSWWVAATILHQPSLQVIPLPVRWPSDKTRSKRVWIIEVAYHQSHPKTACHRWLVQSVLGEHWLAPVKGFLVAVSSDSNQVFRDCSHVQTINGFFAPGAVAVTPLARLALYPYRIHR